MADHFQNVFQDSSELFNFIACVTTYLFKLFYCHILLIADVY